MSDHEKYLEKVKGILQPLVKKILAEKPPSPVIH